MPTRQSFAVPSSSRFYPKPWRPDEYSAGVAAHGTSILPVDYCDVSAISADDVIPSILVLANPYCCAAHWARVLATDDQNCQGRSIAQFIYTLVQLIPTFRRSLRQNCIDIRGYLFYKSFTRHDEVRCLTTKSSVPTRNSRAFFI